MARTWPRPDATAAGAVHQCCGASCPARPALPACPPRCGRRDVPEAVRSILQTRTGAERRWPGPGRVRTQRCPVGPPALWRKLPGQARTSSATCPRPSAPSARTEPALRDDGQDLAALGCGGARAVHQRCGASCLATGPRFERDVPQAARSIGQDTAGAERRWPGPGRVRTQRCPVGPPVLRRKLPGQARTSSATCPRPSAPSARTEPALRDDGQGLAAVGRDGCRRGPPVLRRKRPGQARASSATCPRPSAPSARPEPALRDDGQDLAAPGRNGVRSVHQRCGASCLARPAVRARRAPGRSLHRPGHSRR